MKLETLNLKHKIVIGITGASGAIYALELLNKIRLLKEQIEDCSVIISDNGKAVWEYEIGVPVSSFQLPASSFIFYDFTDMFAPPASGSAGYDTMIVCPCSMGTLGKIAHGTSDNLIIRAADVILKERKRLILVTREMPLSLIHINNMKLITEAGGIICPASPSFYSKPDSIDKLVNTVIEKVLSLAGFSFTHFHWGKQE
jgi:flavin prenyltransferase